MKNAAISMLLWVGVSFSGGVFACGAGGGHEGAKAGASTSSTPAPSPAK